MADKRTKSQKKTDKAVKNRVYQILTAGGISRDILKQINFKRLIDLTYSDLPYRKKSNEIKKLLNSMEKETRKEMVAALEIVYSDQFSRINKTVEQFTGKKLKVPSKKDLKKLFELDLARGVDEPFGGAGGTPKQMYESTWRAMNNASQQYATAELAGQASKAAFRSAINKFKRDMESTTRTMTYATITEAENRVYKANSDIIRGIMFSAVLDGRTTQFCMSIDGTIVELSDPMRAPFHVNCRTTNIPVMEGETDSEAKEALDYRSRVGAGPGYEEGSTAKDKKPTAATTKSRLKKNPDGTYARDADGNYIRTKPGKNANIKVETGKSEEASSYGDFLKSQFRTGSTKEKKSGEGFIRDALGKTRGKAFMDAIKADPGEDPQKILKKILNASIKELKKAA